MIQNVDLLSGELRPRPEHLTLRQLVTIWMAFAGLLVSVSFWHGISTWRLAAEQADKQALWQALEQTNASLRATLNERASVDLVTEVETLRQRLENRALLMNVVERYEQTSERGFSPYLEDLASRRVEGLALTRITFSDGGSHILLAGETAAAINVPRLLKRLAESGSFRGHRFDDLELQALETGLLEFAITGPKPEGQG